MSKGKKVIYSSCQICNILFTNMGIIGTSSYIDTFRIVNGIRFNTLRKMKMNNKKLAIKKENEKYREKAIVTIMKE